MVPKGATKIALLTYMAATLAVMCGVAGAQDLEPRAYSPAPVGTNFVIFTYAHSSGNFLPDPTLPIQHANVQFNNVAFGYYHSFGLFGRQTSVSVGAPYVWGSGDALVKGAQTHIDRKSVV